MAWSSALQQLSAWHPEEREAAIFYASRCSEPRLPSIRLTPTRSTPPLASLALPAARAYAKIAPAEPHALHMPSHIFTRLGLWQESIESNVASEAVPRSHAAQSSPGAITQDGLHAMDYLVYAYLQACQDRKAGAVVAQAAATTVDFEVFQAAYAFAAIPARFALERRNWPDAAALVVHPAGFPWGRFRYAEATTHFARALGAARIGDTALAEAEVAELADIQQTLTRSKEEYPWSTVVEVQRLTASAWVAHARADQAALRWMRSAADLEDKTEKHPVTPGPVLPARELLGDLLMELNQPARALPEFEAVLGSSPKRFHATYGAPHSAELSGNRPKAIERYSELLRLCGNPYSERPEIPYAPVLPSKAMRSISTCWIGRQASAGLHLAVYPFRPRERQSEVVRLWEKSPPTKVSLEFREHQGHAGARDRLGEIAFRLAQEVRLRGGVAALAGIKSAAEPDRRRYQDKLYRARESAALGPDHVNLRHGRPAIRLAAVLPLNLEVEVLSLARAAGGIVSGGFWHSEFRRRRG